MADHQKICSYLKGENFSRDISESGFTDMIPSYDKTSNLFAWSNIKEKEEWSIFTLCLERYNDGITWNAFSCSIK